MPIVQLKRREFLKAALMGAATGLASSIWPRRLLADENTLFVNTWGGRYLEVEEKVFFKPFEAETGIKVTPVTPTSFAKIKAVVETKNYEFDVTNPSEVDFQQGVSENLFEPVDFAALDKSKVPAVALSSHGVASTEVASVIAYRMDKFPNGGPQTWADFWDVEKFPGTRSLYDRPYSNICFALIADGVPIDKLYPLDIERAYRKLDQIKPHIKVWWTQGNQSEQLLFDGEVDVMSIWNARAYSTIDKGAPIGISWQGSEHNMGYWGVLRGTPRAENAWKFLEYYSGAERQAKFCEQFLYGPSNPDALKLVPEEVARRFPTHPDNLNPGFRHNLKELIPQLPAMRERWAQWIAS